MNARTGPAPTVQHGIDRWIPWFIIGFFVVLFCVQAVFVSIAVGTFPGLVTDQPYSVGLSYNETLARQKAEAALGWRVAPRFEATGPLAGTLTLEAAGLPREGALVLAQAERMTRYPQIVPLTPPGGLALQEEGRVALPVRLPVAGRWFVRLEVVAGADRLGRIVEVEVAP